MSTIYTFREITEIEDLGQAFRLRYNAYKDNDLKVFLPENESGIDISHFDLHSKILGIFSGDELIATNRLCVERNMLFNENVLRVGRQYGFFNDADQPNGFSYNGHEEYPFLSFLPSSPAIKQYHEQLKATNTFIAECGRFAIHNQYRSVRIMKFMFDCMFIFGMPLFGNQKRVVVTETFARHTAIYKSYGFKEISIFQFEKLDQTCSLLSLVIDQNLSQIPEKLRCNFPSLLQQFKSTGKVELEF
jgi:hypothetical protein